MRYLIVTLLLIVSSTASRAVLQIDITEGVDDAMPIAVVPFAWTGGGKLMNADVSAIIKSDLARSGKFSPLPDKDLLARPRTPKEVDFKTWRIAGIDHLVIGEVQLKPDGSYLVEFRLIDVLRAQQVLGYSFPAEKDTLRYVAHRISDYIIEHLTGLPGAFNSRIAYVTSRTLPGNKTEYRLQVADTDGYNPQTLLTSSEPIMSPVWSPQSDRIAYVSFEDGVSKIFIHDVRNGKRRIVSAHEGINGAPAWSPDGERLAITLSKDGNPDIYILNVRDGSTQRITRHWAIDTEAAWMPDGRSLVFTSSRSGKPQLYRIELQSGARPERLTYEGDYNANPSVSPDGKMLTFVQGSGNTFKIAVLYIETGLMDILTDGPLDESPEFAPNGSMILYATLVNDRAVLAAVSTDGRHKQRLVLSEGEVREPSWAALRK